MRKESGMYLNFRSLSLTVVAASVVAAGCSANGVSPATAPGPAVTKSVKAQTLPAFDIYVASNGSNVVDEYTSAGSLVRSFEPPPSQGFSGPNGDAYDSKNKRLYVNDGSDSPISEFTTNGKYKGNFADPGNGSGGATYGIAYDANDDVLFLQTGDGIYELTKSGKVLASNTTYGPTAVAYDSRDKLVLAVIKPGSSDELGFYDTNLKYLGAVPMDDNSNYSSLLWNTENDLLYDGAGKSMYAYQVDAKTMTLTQVTLSGSFGGLHWVSYVVNDKAGDVIVSDGLGGDVVAFDDEGNYLSTIASGINSPWGIAIVSK